MDFAQKVVEAGARMRVVQNGLAISPGTTIELLTPNPQRWAIIFTIVSGGPVDISPVPFNVPIFTIVNGSHELVDWEHFGTLTQSAYNGFSIAGASINVTEIWLLHDTSE